LILRIWLLSPEIFAFFKNGVVLVFEHASAALGCGFISIKDFEREIGLLVRHHVLIIRFDIHVHWGIAATIILQIDKRLRAFLIKIQLHSHGVGQAVNLAVEVMLHLYCPVVLWDDCRFL